MEVNVRCNWERRFIHHVVNFAREYMIYYIFYFTFICTPGCLTCLICLVTWLIQIFALRSLLYGNYPTPSIDTTGCLKENTADKYGHTKRRYN